MTINFNFSLLADLIKGYHESTRRLVNEEGLPKIGRVTVILMWKICVSMHYTYRLGYRFKCTICMFVFLVDEPEREASLREDNAGEQVAKCTMPSFYS